MKGRHTVSQQSHPAVSGKDAHLPCPGRRLALVAMAAAGGIATGSSQVSALSAAGAFGRGANAQMLRAVRAITEALTNNLLGFIGATIVLVIVGLAAGHIFGDERAHEKTLKVVRGVFMLVAASGIVA